MTITIKIDTGNAAFQGDNKHPEIVRIVQEWAARLTTGNRWSNYPPTLRDVNGNTVGTVTVTGL